MEKALELSIKYKTLLNKYEVNTPLRLAHFFAQITHESGLKPIQENLNYSKEGLLKTFKKYFPTIGAATPYHRKPMEIANKVYANRMGNGDEKSEDGWKYRGRYFIQITGKDNYIALQKATGIDYADNPDEHLNEVDSMIAALWYWKVNKLNILADKDNLDAVSDVINLGRVTPKVGDSNGYADRLAKLIEYKKIFK